MTQAERQITLEHLAWLKDEAAKANASYDAARKAYKRQQKASNALTRQIKELLERIDNDISEAGTEAQGDPAGRDA